MRDPETLAVVIPVYKGASSLEAVVDEIIASSPSFGEQLLELAEIVLVHDGAVDNSAEVILRLESRSGLVRPVWLSRNFGQHAATFAGCASTTTDWVATMDEDGMHDPRAIPSMVTAARGEGHDLVYAVSPSSPHQRWRSATSRAAKRVAERLLGVPGASRFSSFRFMDGRIARALAAYCGHGVFFDVAALWVFGSSGTVEHEFRDELREGTSGYRLHTLLTHFRRLTVTAGARPLRIAAAVGLLATLVGLAGAFYVAAARLSGAVIVPGWASVMVVMTGFFGLVLFVLGVMAEYLSAALGMVSGRPPYLIVGQPPRSTRNTEVP